MSEEQKPVLDVETEDQKRTSDVIRTLLLAALIGFVTLTLFALANRGHQYTELLRTLDEQLDTDLAECALLNSEESGACEDQVRSDHLDFRVKLISLDSMMEQTTTSWLTVLLGFLSLLLSAYAVFLVWRTLNATHAAVSETAKATNEVAEANRIAEQIGRAQTRSYLSVTGGSYEVNGDNVYVRAALYNSGQSPALNVTVELGVMEQFSIHAAPKFIIDPTMSMSAPISSNSTGHCHTVFHLDRLPEEVSMRLGVAKTYFRLEGVCMWDDVFGGSHATAFALTETDVDKDLGSATLEALRPSHPDMQQYEH